MKKSTMIPEKLQEIMKRDGVVAIATLGPKGPHMVFMKAKFSWLRATLAVTIETATQTW